MHSFNANFFIPPWGLFRTQQFQKTLKINIKWHFKNTFTSLPLDLTEMLWVCTKLQVIQKLFFLLITWNRANAHHVPWFQWSWDPRNSYLLELQVRLSPIHDFHNSFSTIYIQVTLIVSMPKCKKRFMPHQTSMTPSTIYCSLSLIFSLCTWNLVTSIEITVSPDRRSTLSFL